MIQKSKFASLLSAVLVVSMIAGCGSSSAAASAAETTAAAAGSSSSGTEESPAATEAAASEAPALEPQPESADFALITYQDVEAAGLTLHEADIGYRFNSDDTAHDLKMASCMLFSEDNYSEEAGIAWQGYKDESGLHCVNFVMPFGSVNIDTEGKADDLIDSASQYLKGGAAAWLANIKSEIDSGVTSLDETYENGTFSKYENGRFTMSAVIDYQNYLEISVSANGDNASLFDNFLSEEQFDELAH